MRKALLISLILIFSLTGILQSAAAPHVVLDGNNLTFEVPPAIENGRTMVPLRAIFEAPGASVQWDDASRTVTATKSLTVITLTIGSENAYKNGEAVSLDAPGMIVEGRTLVPLRFVSEAFGVQVGWNGDIQTVTLTSLGVGQNGSQINSENSRSTISCVFFNLRRAPGSDQAFREAVSRVIDRKSISEKLLNGSVNPITTFTPPLSDEWTNEKATAPDFDSIRARKILDDAGYRMDQDLKSRIDPKTGKPLSITIITPQRQTSPVLWIIGYDLDYYLNAIGLKAVHLALPDYLLLYRSMQNREFDILVQDIALDQTPYGLYELLHSSRDKAGTPAYTGLHDSGVDAYLEKLRSGKDDPLKEKESCQAALDVQERLGELLPYVVVCSTPSR